MLLIRQLLLSRYLRLEGTTAETPYSTNDPVGNGPDGKLNTADDVVIKDLYAVGGLTFVRPRLVEKQLLAPGAQLQGVI